MAKKNRPSDEEIFEAYNPLQLIHRFDDGVEVNWDRENQKYLVGKPGGIQFPTYSKEIALAVGERKVYADGRGNPLK